MDSTVTIRNTETNKTKVFHTARELRGFLTKEYVKLYGHAFKTDTESLAVVDLAAAVGYSLVVKS